MKDADDADQVDVDEWLGDVYDVCSIYLPQSRQPCEPRPIDSGHDPSAFNLSLCLCLCLSLSLSLLSTPGSMISMTGFGLLSNGLQDVFLDSNELNNILLPVCSTYSTSPDSHSHSSSSNKETPPSL